jgi:hypothetical protein
MTSLRVIEEPIIEKSKIEKNNSENNEEFVDNLVIYYFDQKKGPTMFYSSDKACFGYLDPKRFLDVIESGTFILALKNYQTINHIFSIDSNLARGRQETILITYMVKHPEMEDIFRHLKSKTLVLEEFEDELKKLEELPSLLHTLDDTSILYDLGTDDFNEKFLKIYEKFYKKLSLKFKILKPINELRPENIDTFSVKLYIKPDDLTYALNALLLKKKINLIIDKADRLDKKIIDFFGYIFYDTFKIDLNIKKKKFYKKNKKLIILETKPFNANKYLREIVKKFYSNKDSISAIINLRDKIRELFVLTRRICESFENEGRPQFLYRKNMIKDLETVFYVKVNKDYFSFLNEIVRNYHDLEIVWVQEYIAEKIEGMWSRS